MADTPKLALTRLLEAQAGAEVTVNDFLNRLDSIVNCSVKDRDLATPPGSPVEGDAYLIATSPTGDWAGQAGKITAYFSGWIFFTPKPGLLVHIQDEDVLLLLKADGTTYGTVTVT